MTLDVNNVPTNNLYAIIHQEYKILAEYKMIQSENIHGIYVIPSSESALLWFGVIFVREGVYNDGIFRFNISLPKQFPSTSEAPTITFQNSIFHPLICPKTGSLDISDEFYDWNKNDYHMWQVLKYIQFIFVDTVSCANAIAAGTTTTISTINQEAVDLLQQNRSEFLIKAKECVQKSKIEIYDAPPTNDKHYMTFEQFDENVHGSVLENIKNKTDTSMSPPTSGLSWVNEGEFKPMSK